MLKLVKKINITDMTANVFIIILGKYLAFES